jgi:hypothetical protein
MSESSSILGSSALRRWWRRHSDRESIVDFLKTMVWVIPLTILIWVYAEQEQVSPAAGEQILITLKSADPNRIVTIGHQGDESVICDLKGPRAKLEFVRAELAKNPVTITVPATLSPGAHQLESAQHVREASIFVDNGITVSNIRPMTIPIVIDTLEEIELPVQAPEQINVASAVFEPRTVRIRGPHALLTSADTRKSVVAIVDISANPDLARPGPHGPTTLPVISPLTRDAGARGENVTISPPNVTATFTVQQAAGELTIDSMPVWVEAAEPISDEFRVQADLFVHNVKVTGPADQLALIRNGTYNPHATLTIRREDTQAGTTRQAVLWFDNGSLPPGVTVSKVDRERPFDFKVVQRAKG